MPSVAERDRKPFTTTDDDVFDPVECLRIHEKVMGPQMVHHGGLRFIQSLSAHAFPSKHTLPPDTRVLNIGCGFGGLACQVLRDHPEVAHVIVCDPNQHLIDETRRRIHRHYPDLERKILLYCMDLDSIRFLAGLFDAIICIELNAMPCDDRAGLVGQKFKEWLKPGGRLVMADYCWSGQAQSQMIAVAPEESFSPAVWDDTNYRVCLRDSYSHVSIDDDTVDQLCRVNCDLTRLQKKEPYNKREETLMNETIDQWRNLKEMLVRGALTWRLFRATTPALPDVPA